MKPALNGEAREALKPKSSSIGRRQALRASWCPYRVELAPAAQRDLRRLGAQVMDRLSGPIQALVDK